MPWNPTTAVLAPMHWHEDPEIVRRNGEHLRFFGYTIGKYYVDVSTVTCSPGRSTSCEELQAVRSHLPDMGVSPTSAIGTPDEIPAAPAYGHFSHLPTAEDISSRLCGHDRRTRPRRRSPPGATLSERRYAGKVAIVGGAASGRSPDPISKTRLREDPMGKRALRGIIRTRRPRPRPDDITQPVAFLGYDAAANLDEAVITSDGGWTSA